MTEREIVEGVERLTSEAVQHLQYQHSPPIPHLLGSPKREWYLAPLKTEFRTAALCIGLYRPKRWCLIVDFFGSPFPLDQLGRDGLDFRCVMVSLHHYQLDYLGADYGEVLPPQIDFSSGADATTVLTKLRSEIWTASNTVWPDLWKLWLTVAEDLKRRGIPTEEGGIA